MQTPSGGDLIRSLFSLEGKTALITGSSQGLGLVFAEGLAGAGAKVIINGRNREKVDLAAAALGMKGYSAAGYAFDITDSQQVGSQVARIEEHEGPIDILVNNAGIQHRSPLEEFGEEDWKRVIDTNLSGVFIVTKNVVQGMIKRKRGKIIHICSLQSELGRDTITPYAASKGGVKMLTRGMATEWGRYNIQVNGLGPGYFITEMTKPLSLDETFDSWIRKRTPMGRWGDPEELVGPLLFLASQASSYLTGQLVYVDGGILSTI